MTATSVLLILVGVFIIANSQNLVGVFQGNKAFSFQGATPTKATTETSPGKTTDDTIIPVGRSTSNSGSF